MKERSTWQELRILREPLRSFNTDLINNGTVNVDQNGRSIRGNAVLTNNGNFNVANGATFNNTTSTTFNQTGGTLDNQGAFEMSSDTFNFNGGNITGNAIVMTGGNLNVSSTGTGSFLLRSVGNIDGNIASGQIVTVDAVGNNVVWTAQSDFTNQGTINISSDSTLDATLARDGTITNQGTINFDGLSASAGTFRRLTAVLDNQGTVDVIATGPSTEIGRTGANHLNSGTIISRQAGSVIEFIGDTFTNQAAGRLEGVGEFDYTDTGLVNLGTIAPGLSPGTMTLDGDVTLGGTSELEFELGGTSQGTDFDFLSALDTLELDGSLDIRLINGFQNSITSLDNFTIISAGTLNGTFAGLLDGATIATADGFGEFTINYTGNNVVLSNFQLNAAVPEPGSLITFGLLGGLVGLRRRRIQRV